jgi:hypothetical protein
MVPLVCLSLPAAAAETASERWVMSTGDGHAMLSFSAAANGAPEIMFICGESHRSMARVLVFRAPDPENARRIRIELVAGAASAMAAAEPAALLGHDRPVLIGSIEAQQMRDIIQSPAPRLGWRVADENGPRAQNVVAMPPALGRQRNAFLRFCD